MSKETSSLSKKSLSRSLSAKSNAKTEQFYIGDKNSKGAVFSKYPNTKSVRKAIPIITILDKEENLPTKEVFIFVSFFSGLNFFFNKQCITFKSG
jgi:hypothetical protein